MKKVDIKSETTEPVREDLKKLEAEVAPEGLANRTGIHAGGGSGRCRKPWECAQPLYGVSNPPA